MTRDRINRWRAYATALFTIIQVNRFLINKTPHPIHRSGKYAKISNGKGTLYIHII